MGFFISSSSMILNREIFGACFRLKLALIYFLRHSNKQQENLNGMASFRHNFNIWLDSFRFLLAATKNNEFNSVHKDDLVDLADKAFEIPKLKTGRS
jgi:hypothetical protein